MVENLSIFILTYNEAIHLERCLDNARKLTSNIYVIDSFSTDETLQILKDNNIPFDQNKFINHADQVNFAIQHNPYQSKWVFRMDSDELLTEQLIEEIKIVTQISTNPINGYYIKRKVLFLGKMIQYGMTNPIWLLRLWKLSDGVCNDKWMDEKIILKNSNTNRLTHLLVDHNLNDLTWWITKHNHYATREAIEALRQKYDLENLKDLKIFTSKTDDRILHLKRFYNSFPLFIRPFLLFIYSYFLKFGILDGKQGLIWNLLQVFWYRFLVDVKVYQFELSCNFDLIRIKNKLKEII